MKTVVTLGLQIVDILGRPVSHVPPGQQLALLDEIRITVAGTAARHGCHDEAIGKLQVAGAQRLVEFIGHFVRQLSEITRRGCGRVPSIMRC